QPHATAARRHPAVGLRRGTPWATRRDQDRDHGCAAERERARERRQPAVLQGVVVADARSAERGAWPARALAGTNRTSVASARAVAASDRRTRATNRRGAMKVVEVKERCQGVLVALSEIVVGKERVLRQIMAGILANGHILIEDNPGLA